MSHVSTHAQALGEVAWLLTQSPLHRERPIKLLETLIMPPLLHHQFRLFRDEQSLPIGFASWVMATPRVITAIKERVATGTMPAVQPHEWKSGDMPFLIDFICPFVTQENQLTQKLTAQLKQDIFQGHSLNGLRVENIRKERAI